MVATKKPTVAIERAEPGVIVMDGRMNRQLFAQIAVGAVRAGVAFLQAQLANDEPPPAPPLPFQLPAAESNRDVMTADEVAAFLGVDRNTVYDYAGRGVIPHQRLGKRVLFRRGALVSWLDDSCKATAIRKG
jgi:excisionase family DNA binding protein